MEYPGNQQTPIARRPISHILEVLGVSGSACDNEQLTLGTRRAHTFATVYSTTFLSDISDLLPTSSLLTPSVAYLSISCSHCLTLLNESISVTS
jgi:hypothetical protein